MATLEQSIERSKELSKTREKRRAGVDMSWTHNDNIEVCKKCFCKGCDKCYNGFVKIESKKRIKSLFI